MACFYEGKLVTYKHRPSWGIGLVDGPSYTKRFMDPEDHEMVAHGMGQYAGRYGGAVNIIFPEAGKTVRGIATSDIKLVPAAPADTDPAEACR